MSREEILLKEYELCQRHNSDVANHYWIVSGTFLTVNTAVFTGIVYSILSGNIPRDLGFWVVLLLGLALGTVLWFLRLYRRRIDFQISVNWHRAREIELELGMWKNWRVVGVDSWKGDDFSNQISNDMKTRLLRYHSKDWWKFWRESETYQSPIGRKTADLMFYVLIGLWPAFAIMLGILLLTNC